MPIPECISNLINKFEHHSSELHSPNYNEMALRTDYINPFFEELGWDVTNKKGWAQAFRDVIQEAKVKDDYSTKKPDYSFRIGATPVFFVEAKKPAVDIEKNPNPALQLRSYIWSKGLKIGIVTDFEEFAVYDGRVKPTRHDKAATARLFYYNYQEYPQRWGFIHSIFSREEIAKGSIDQLLKGPPPKGTTTVDEDFLKNMDEWRLLLARNIALRNKELSNRELNYVVQKILDRIIFLRICEDREIEPQQQLRGLLEGHDIYPQLCDLFVKADARYNSGIFHFSAEKGRTSHPDELSLDLEVDDKVLKHILQHLYYPDSPYAFGVMPADILGQVYERFLGKVIRLTAGHQAKVEDKPEVKKAGGVYYTPSYIVDYIVKNTVGKLIKNKTPDQISDLKVLDPACGSGSFLINAYQLLADYHLYWYVKHDPEKWGKGKNPRIYRVGGAKDWLLTTAEKKRILLNNIYGVDIDPQAVEVTKLSLLLKVLENENQETIGQQMDLFKERALPDLGDNIKCGNSLIGSDFYEGKQLGMFDEEELYRINAFDWEEEFAGIMRRGGFDAVIGNPPYLGGRDWKKEHPSLYEYFINKSDVAEYQYDIYVLFWERGIKLLKSGGMIGYITPNTWLNNKSCLKLRDYILKNTRINQIADYSDIKVFDKATVLTIITILKKGFCEQSKVEVYIPQNGKLVQNNIVLQKLWSKGDQKIFKLKTREIDYVLHKKIETSNKPLNELSLVKFGIKLYETGKGTPPQKPTDAKNHIYEANTKKSEEYRKYLEGKDINRYNITWKNKWLKYGKNLAAPRDPVLFIGPRILIRRIIGKRLIGTFTEKDYVTSQLLQIVKPIDTTITKYLLGILNSTMMGYYLRSKYCRQDKTFPEIRIYELASLPIKVISLENKHEATQLNKMVSLVDQMLKLQKQIAAAKNPNEKKQLERLRDATDKQIDGLVYELYGLSEEEIRIVEGEK